MKSLRLKFYFMLIVPAIMIAFFMPLFLANGLSVSSDSALMYIDKTEAFTAQGTIQLPVPPQRIDNQVFIPVNALADFFDWKVESNLAERKVTITSPERIVIYDFKTRMIIMDGLESPIGWNARFRDGTFFIRARGLSTFFNLNIDLNTQLQHIYLTYVPPVAEDVEMPIARFYTPKTAYKIGERIQYFDVSYSPTEQTLATSEWSGREDVFFEPGEKIVKLRVTDKAGKQSRWFTKTITILPEVFYNQLQYHIYSEDVGKTLPFSTNEMRQQIINLPRTAGFSSSPEERTLLISNSPETVDSFGILYSDRLSGKVRIYASHVNGTSERMIFAVLVTNPSGREVTLTMSRRGEIVPTRFAQLNGRQGTLEYMMDQQPPKRFLIPARGTTLLAKLPTLQTQQGVHVIYDIDPSIANPLRYHIIAVPETTGIRSLIARNLIDLKQLPYNKHVRGTFPGAEKRLMLSGTEITEPRVLKVGDGRTDAPMQGIDVTTKQVAVNPGNFGAMYRLTVAKPPKMTIMLRASAGPYKGHFKINDGIVLVPDSGSLRPSDGLFLLARTTGSEDVLNIEFSPPAGSYLPIDVLFFPHDNGGSLYDAVR